MAVGWAKDEAVNDQIAASVEDAVARSRGSLPKGKSLLLCEECGDTIPKARREALPGVRLCIHCQEKRDAGKPPFIGYNHQKRQGRQQ
ncbi:MAG TPA: DksA/TraR family C4-type zinc finger protein [Desulfobulbaceae bacterium]|nr:DksA/TraR family C4-type zinc finger protein [Desulfobulbaceae bacterium]